MARNRDGSLSKQKVAVTFQGGVDEVTAEALVVPGRMEAMENGVYKKTGEISKRNGYDDLNVDVDRAWPSIYSSVAPFPTPPFVGPVTTGESMGVLEDELLLFDGNYVVSRSSKDVNWTYRDQATPVITTSERIGWGQQSELGRASGSSFEREVTKQHAVQMIIHNGLRVYTWYDNDPVQNVSRRQYFSVIDDVTGDRLIVSELVYATSTGLRYGGAASRLVAMGDYIFCITIEGGTDLVAVRMDSANFDAASPWSDVYTVATDVHPTNQFLDAVEIDDTEVAVAYVRQFNQTDYIRTLRMDNVGTVLASVDTAEDCNRCLSVYKDSVSGRIGIAWCNLHSIIGNNGLQDTKFILWDAALTNVPANWAVYQAGPFGMLINQESVDVAGAALHVSLGPGLQDSYLSVIWDSHTGVTGADYTNPYLPPQTRVKIRHCSSSIITTQADYDINAAGALANGVVGQTTLASGIAPAGNQGYNPDIFYATLASRQFKRGNYVYFAVVQPHTPAQRVPDPDPDDPNNWSYYIPLLQDGNTDTSYGLMRMECAGATYAEFVAPTAAVAQFKTKYSKQSICSIVGKFCARISGGNHTQAAVSRLNKDLNTDKYHWAGAEIALGPAEPGERSRNIYGEVEPIDAFTEVPAFSMLAECFIDFSDLQNRYESVVKNQLRLTAGGVVSSYDKSNFTQDSWSFAPEIWAPGGANVTTGTPPNYTVQIVAVYEWWDNRGQRHQSAPSVPYVFKKLAAGAPFPGPLYVNTYGWLPKDTRVVIYRTTNNGTTFYRLPEHSTTNPEDKPGVRAYPYAGSDSLTGGAHPGLVAVPDTAWWTPFETSETALTSNEILYTDGGVVPNEEPPSNTCIADWDGRVWVGGLSQKNQVAFSKTLRSNESVNFSDIFRLEVGSQLEKVVALQGMDDKLIVFKEDSIYVIYGDGPNDLGQGATYRAQLVTSEQGCLGPKGVISTPKGVMFHNPAGIYMVTRSLQIEFAGARVEDTTTNRTVHGAALVPDKTQVRFMLSGGNYAVVYDYLLDVWYRFTNHQSCAGGSCEMWKGNFSFLNAGGAMKVQNAGYLDDFAAGTGTYIPTTLETAWIKSGDVEGLQRVYKALVLGELIVGHTLTINVGFDYDSAYTDTKTWTPAELAALPRYQLEIRPSRQRCQAIRFRIQDTGTPPTESQGYIMTYLMLEVGIQQGLYKRYPIAEARK